MTKKADALYAVKSFYRWMVKGKELTNVEERIILVSASTFEEAFKKAKKEAKNYTKQKFKNPFDQQVTMEVLDYFDAYEVSDDFEDGAELFSSSNLLNQKVSNKKLISKLVDFDQKKIPDEAMNLYFRNVKFNKKMKEKDFLKKIKGQGPV